MTWCNPNLIRFAIGVRNKEIVFAPYVTTDITPVVGNFSNPSMTIHSKYAIEDAVVYPKYCTFKLDTTGI